MKQRDFKGLINSYCKDEIPYPEVMSGDVVVWNQYDDTYHVINDVTVDDDGTVIVEVS